MIAKMLCSILQRPLWRTGSRDVLTILRSSSRRPFSVSQLLGESFQKLYIGESKKHFIAYRKYSPRHPAKDVGIIFCQGLMSNMNGIKATFLESFCQERRLKFVCFDYIGHGQSSGKFENFTLSLWKENTLDILEKVAEGTLLCNIAFEPVRGFIF